MTSVGGRGWWLIASIFCSACQSGAHQGPNEPISPDAGKPIEQVDGGSPCGMDAWSTYAHDLSRSSASGGCVTENPILLWRYTPTPPDGSAVIAIYNAVARQDAMFVAWGVTGYPFGVTQALDRVNADGTAAWSFVPGFGDAARGYWPSIGLGGVAYASDGLYWIDQVGGSPIARYSVDYWGQTAVDEARFYVVNTWFVDGPKMFVGAYSFDGQEQWEQNQAGAARLDFDSAGGIAIDGEELFFAPHYALQGHPPPPNSGVYAFGRDTGDFKWFFSCTPLGPPSARDGVVFILADTATQSSSLCAIDERDGSTRWLVPEQPFSANAPPLIAGGLVITRSFSEVTAFNIGNGTLAWQRNFSFPAFSNQTSLAAAEGSATLIVLQPYPINVQILNLRDGSDRWSGLLPGAAGPLSNPIVVGNRFYVVDSGGLTSAPAVLAFETPPP